MTASDRDLLSTTEAARRLGVTPGQVRLLIRQGRLSAIRVGERSWVLDAAAVDAFQRMPVGRPRKAGGISGKAAE